MDSVEKCVNGFNARITNSDVNHIAHESFSPVKHKKITSFEVGNFDDKHRHNGLM